MTRGRPRLDPMKRFMAKIRRDRWGHWQWTAHRSVAGYGQFSMSGKGSSMPAHRAAWLLYRGPIPDGMHVHHVCRVRSCVNPDHLLLVTPKQNTTERSLHKGRIEVCKHGHVMDDDNIGWRIHPSGRADRFCRTCQNASNRRSYAAHADERRAYARDRWRAKHQQLRASIVTVAM